MYSYGKHRTVRLSEAVWQALKKLKKQKRKTMDAVLRELLELWETR